MFTLEYAGQEKAFAAVGAIPGWGIALQGCGLNKVNGQPDTYRFRIPVADAATAPAFPDLAEVVIRRGRAWGGASFTGGYIAFRGYRLPHTHDIQSNSEYLHYTFGNAFYLLSQTPFQQPAAAYLVASVGFQFQTSLIFYTKISEGGADFHFPDPPPDPDEDPAQLPGYLLWITNGKEIKEILEHALEMYDAQGIAAPFQVGTIDPDLALPSYPMQEIDCAAGILAALQLSHDCTIDWDYTTTPPTINVVKRENRTPVDMAVKTAPDYSSLNLMPVDNTPSVVIIYFRVHIEVDGEPFVQYARQKYGPNGANSDDDPEGGLNALIQTVDLLGPSYVNGYLKTGPCTITEADALTPDDPAEVAANRSFWALVKPELSQLASNPNRYKIRKMSFYDTTIFDEDGNELDVSATLAEWPNVLLDGSTIQSWMQLADGTPVTGLRVTIKANVSYDEYHDAAASADETLTTGKIVRRVYLQEFNWNGTLTNGVTGSYSQTTRAGEDIPENLAQKMWNSLSVPQFEGSHSFVESEITGQIGLANTLNLTGGLAAWAAMTAQIQSIFEDDGTGKTTITFGPARQLNAGELSEISRWNRFRHPSTNLAQRENGKS